MKTYKICFWVFVISLLVSCSVFSQVQVILQQPPPNQLFVEDLWKITLNNPANTAFTVYLTGTATENSQGQILSGTTKSFTLLPGLKALNPGQMGEINIEYKSPEVKDIIKNTGSVPAGYYNICISVFNASDNQLIGNTCIFHEVNNYTEPILVSPLNLTTLRDEFPVFSWLPPTPVKAGQRVTFKLIIAELLPRQTPADALASNPAFYEQKDIVSSTLLYNTSSRKFEDGKSYAWKIRAYVNGVFIAESCNYMFLMQQMTVRNFSEYNKTVSSILKTGSDNRKDSIRNLRSESGDNKNFKYYSSSMHFNFLSPDNLPHTSGLFASSQRPGYVFLLSKISSRNTFLQNIDLSGLQSLKPPSKINLSGISRIYGINSNRQGTGSNLPDDLARWELNSTLSVYNIPLSLSLLLSTEQRSSLQNINSFSFSFDSYKLTEQLKNKAIERTINPAFNREHDEIKEKLKSNNLSADDEAKLKTRLAELEKTIKDIEDIKLLQEPGEITAKLEKYGSKISWLNKFFMSFRNLGIGTNYPSYTNNTLSGVPVSGINIEMNPGPFYFAVTGLKNQKAIQNAEDNRPVYERKILGARFGFGKFEGTHFYFTYLKAWDDENSIKRDITTISTPMKNNILGLQTKIIIIENVLNIEGEIAASLLTRDVTSPDISNSSIPSFFQKLFSVKMSSSMDYSYSIKTLLNIDKSKTKLAAEIKMAGPGFTSLGAPNIRNDNFEYNFKVEQGLFNNRINVSAFLNRNRDNLIAWKRSTTTNTFFGVNLGIRFANLPYLMFNYSPCLQENDLVTDSLKIKNKTVLYSLSTGYAYKVSNLFLFTNATLSLQESETRWKLSNYSTNTFMLNQSVSFLFPVTLAAGAGLTETRFADSYTNIKYYDFSASYTAFNIWTNTIGLSYAKEKNLNNKTGIYINSSIPVWLIGALELRAEKNIYNDKSAATNSYNEFLFKATFTSNW